MKKITLKILCLPVLIAGLAASAAAEDGEPVMTIRLKDAPLSTLLGIVSFKSGFNFNLSDPDLAERKVTLFLTSATVSDVIELMEKAKNIKIRRLGAGKNYLVASDTAPFTGYPPLTGRDLEEAAFKRPFSVRVKGAMLPNFLDTVSGLSKVNFVLVGDAQYIPVTAHLEDVTIIDILQFLKTKGLSYSRIGRHNVFVVSLLRPETSTVASAEKAFTDKRYEEAISIYKNLLAGSPDSDMADYALLRMAISYDWIAARDNSRAVVSEERALLERLIRDYPRSMRLGDAYL